eukprot:gb/GFBE01063953.1/.p1 GENE.gb/GFBE01063953.1/~~gb/GFBE01063953.1/.p1  ORF type:complete len:483 (+),score=142.28 gb/GFBE01063953.1/:1-1449(+)
MMHQLSVVFALINANVAVARVTSQLPKVHADAPPTSLMDEGKWWAKVGDHIVHTPHESTGLSQNVNDYYYLYGSPAALTQELQENKVGGAGRLHIIHLPGGEQSLQAALPQKAGRRSAVSSLVQLSSEKVLSDSHLFPDYKLPEDYKSGLNAEGSKLEKQVVDALSKEKLMSELTELTSLGDGADRTRSYSNGKATENSVKFIEKEFKAAGLETCRQVNDQGLTTVVAYLQGSDEGKNGAVTLGGHYDSRPFDGLAPGAVDNGSGSAAVLSIAKAFMAAKIKPTRTIYFAAFAAEEPGLLGSEEFASRLHDSDRSGSFLEGGSQVSADKSLLERICNQHAATLIQANVRGKMRREHKQKSKHHALIMDEIAWKSPNIGSDSHVVNLESFDWAKTVLNSLAGSSFDHNKEALQVTHSGHPFGSDHMSFLNKGYEAVLSIHGDDEAYPNYHTQQDDMDQVNPELYTMIVKMNAGALVRLAGVDN